MKTIFAQEGNVADVEISVINGHVTIIVQASDPSDKAVEGMIGECVAYLIGEGTKYFDMEAMIVGEKSSENIVIDVDKIMEKYSKEPIEPVTQRKIVQPNERQIEQIKENG